MTIRRKETSIGWKRMGIGWKIMSSGYEGMVIDGKDSPRV